MIYIVVIISFLLDSFVSLLINSNSLLMPVFSLLSLVIIYPYIKKEDYLKYFITCAVTGILYDIIYTNTLFLNLGLFILLGLCVKLIFNIFSNNLLSNALTSIVIIILYRMSTYFILIIGGYLDYSFLKLLESIYSSIIVNLIYIIIFYLVINFISNKFRIKPYK